MKYNIFYNKKKFKVNKLYKKFYLKYKNIYIWYKIFIRNFNSLENIYMNLINNYSFLYKHINLKIIFKNLYFYKKKLNLFLNLNKFLLWSYFYFLKLKSKEKIKLKNIKKINYFDLKIKKFFLKKKLMIRFFFNKLRKWKIKKFLKIKWFRLIFKNFFFRVQTLNYNKLLLIKYLKNLKLQFKNKNKKVKTCLLILKKNNNNFFVILSDFNNKIISYKWAGQFNEVHNIKNKRSYYLIFPIIKNILKKLKKLKIYNIIVKIKSNITPHMYKAIQLLQDNNIIIKKIYFRKPIPHHFGKRKKKLRRI